VITQCCVEALYTLGKEFQSATNLAKTFERRRCNHRVAIDPDACLLDMIGSSNKHNYVLASQSAPLRQKLQNVPGLPIIHFNPREVLVLSPPSIATTRKKNEVEEGRRLEAEKGMEGVVDGGNVIGASADADAGGGGETGGRSRSSAGVRKVKKAPNPLSVRKKKVEKRPREDEGMAVDEAAEEEGDTEAEAGGKRRKKRKRGKGKGVVAEARAELANMGGSDGGSDGVDSE
jgi:U3 small nucleolar RNA-associated protein 23